MTREGAKEKIRTLREGREGCPSAAPQGKRQPGKRREKQIPHPHSPNAGDWVRDDNFAGQIGVPWEDRASCVRGKRS